MTTVSPAIVAMVLISAAAQVVGTSLLPLTRGFTQPLPTLAMAAAFFVGLGLMARIIASGVNLGLLVPVLAALVPMGSILVGAFYYGEAASVAKIGLLALACTLIAVANMV